MSRRPHRSSSTVPQPLSASTPGEQTAVICISSQPTFGWLICCSPLCGTRSAESRRRKPGSRCGAIGRGWLADCKGRLVADDASGAR
jgi:hypothetical protein